MAGSRQPLDPFVASYDNRGKSLDDANPKQHCGSNMYFLHISKKNKTYARFRYLNTVNYMSRLSPVRVILNCLYLMV